MTTKFHRKIDTSEFETSVNRYGNGFQTPVANIVLKMIKEELERCYTLLDCAVEIAEFYAQGRVDLFREESPSRASEFLEKVK